MSDTSDLSRSLVESICADELKSLAGEYAELGIDQLIKEGVLKDIPVVNTVMALAKVGLTVRDHLLINKLMQFLGPLHDLDPKVRRDVVARLENDPNYGRKVGEHLIQLLDRIDTHKKPAMLARTFRAYAQGEIDAELFHRLNHAVVRTPWFEVPDIRKFHDKAERLRLGSATKTDLFLAGLATAAFEPTPVCEAFLELELDRVGA